MKEISINFGKVNGVIVVAYSSKFVINLFSKQNLKFF